MSLLLLDTTFLIDSEQDETDLHNVIEDEDDVAIAAVTVAELLVGVELASGRRRTVRQEYLDDIIGSIPVIPYDTDVAVEHAQLLVAVKQAGRSRGAHDLLIAATARFTGRTVVSADESAFADLPGVAVQVHP